VDFREGERRYVTIGMDAFGRILVVVYTWREENIRIISARKAVRYEVGNMKAKYDFSKGKRGAVLPSSGNKVRITIRLDRDIIDRFRSKVEEQGGGSYQTMLNDALRKHMDRQEPLEEVLRRVVREELHTAQ
jgi:uncharacterized protein (DUF4415 family)